ncbi:metallothionein [Entomobacter blattae]|uniref:metallothionein n=1 Tax=Entomobacter blattae TaxID=2762277 RepID=UPI0023B220C7|nr:metallothionein [Entomobacter blattae]
MSQKTKCSCKDCVCMVDSSKAIQKNGQFYCCEECSNHHSHSTGCNHQGCNCHG